MKTSPITRRNLLKGLGCAAGLSLLPAFPGCVSQTATRPLRTLNRDKLRIAKIGVGGMGESDLKAIVTCDRAAIVALCDVDQFHLNKAASLFPAARCFHDWRKLVADPGVDAFVISTPDHMHAPIAAAAMLCGKHVYCQKPLAHEIHEARRLTLLARQCGVVTQMGIQCHSLIAYRMAAQMIQDGLIGKIREIHLWTDRPCWKQSAHRPARIDPMSQTLCWEQWLGVAPQRPFTAGVYHPARWRGWLDFGTGALGDMGCHIFDTPYRALNLTAPISVLVEGPGANEETFPDWEIIRYVFPGNSMTANSTLPFTWYDGGKLPDPRLVPVPLPRGMGGAILIGAEGVMLLPHIGGPQLFSHGKPLRHPKYDLKPNDHYHQWVLACLGQDTASANFDYSGPLTETVLLGALASRFPNQLIQWDTHGMKITNHPEAHSLLRRNYRPGWESPVLA